jgi:IMP dehydrogenase
MAVILKEFSKTFNEYLLLPNLTTKQCTPVNVSLKTPITKFKKGEEPELMLNIPFTSSIMQSVSDHNLAIALARCGGISFIYQSQAIESQAKMVSKVKNFKAGFVRSDSNLKPDNTLKDVNLLTHKTGHTTIAITEDGTATGRLTGVLTSRDFRPDNCDINTSVSEVMTPFNELIFARDGISLQDANELIWKHKLNSLPILDKNDHLLYLVFRKDYNEHMQNPDELIDKEKRLIVGAGVNTHDYKDRIPALVEAGADILCIDSSDGFSEWQKDTIEFVKNNFSGLKIGAGNVVDKEGFKYLADAGADFIKVGIGGGSICITREQKGIGRGQASAVIDVAEARNEYFKKTGVYIPICSDGGIVHDYHIILALAMGADFVMMGRYFARFDESPSKRLRIQGSYVKEYWGEGSERALNVERYNFGSDKYFAFEEGVDVYIPYAGKLKDNLNLTLTKIKSTMCNCGSLSINELQDKARITPVSFTTIREGAAHDVTLKEKDISPMS